MRECRIFCGRPSSETAPTGACGGTSACEVPLLLRLETSAVSAADREDMRPARESRDEGGTPVDSRLLMRVGVDGTEDRARSS